MKERIELSVISNCKMINDPRDICPHTLEGVLRFIGKSWNIMILGTLGNYSILRFNELQDKLGKISPKTLSSRLKELADVDLIKREVFAEIPPRVEYSLTKNGGELFHYLIPLMQWAQSIDHR